ncbi:M55 family metallopeptidase [Thermogladius sp. 4427co]|uniref:M55 family metallopeptidase n=1 Tax=Thermogladius sp. 4427co TaxID=3450718 RepID=UPI003F79D059
MKAYVSIDLEGLPGIASTTMVAPDKTQFQIGSNIMSRIAQFVSTRLRYYGFQEIYIADSHGLMTNLDYLSLPEGTMVIQGYPRPYSMLTMLDSSFNAVFFIGYHSAAGTLHGFLDHTMSGRVFYEIFVNGVRASEFLLNALYAREKNVPVVLVAGDTYLRNEVENLARNIVFVELKKGVSRYAAVYPRLDDVLKELDKGLSLAVQRLKSGASFDIFVNKPYNVLVRFRDSLVADVVEMMGVERLDAYTVKKVFESASELLGFIEILAYVGLGIEYIKSTIR